MERFSFQTTLHGSGGFAKVIRGRDNTLDRDIAVKVLSPLLTEFSEPDQERFKREARILAKLSHPNIPAIYDVDFDDGKFLIIFQFIEGQTLRDIINESGAVPINQARVWFHQLASALDYAHKLGIIHRDVKPENVIVTPNKESAYLVDFGIAISAEDGKKLTKSGFVVGTPGYMSPEQHAGEPVDERTDVYSLGVTLYETLAGHALRHGAYEPLSNLNETIPPQIDDLISECIDDKPRRLETVRLFSSQLSGALQLPSRPLSEVLTHGKLHEIALYLESLSAADVANLPAGQRDVLISKITDVVGSNEPNLEFPSERFLQLMLTRGVFLPRDDYRDIVAPGIEWAFERYFGSRLGKVTLRDAIEEAAFISRGDAHKVLMEEFTKSFERSQLDTKEGWFLHAVREVIIALMANPSCTESSPVLKDGLKQVNRLQRARE
ncbi:MAG: serine/threonine protein kinase [Acidobacteriia bacterium]|nr:serine/threonine protein kinase [Terriglobia bacterium]